MKRLYLAIVWTFVFVSFNSMQAMKQASDGTSSSEISELMRKGLFGGLSFDALSKVDKETLEFYIKVVTNYSQGNNFLYKCFKGDLCNSINEIESTELLLNRAFLLALESGNVKRAERLKKLLRNWTKKLDETCNDSSDLNDGKAHSHRSLKTKVKKIQEQIVKNNFWWVMENKFFKALHALCICHCEHINKHDGGYLFQLAARNGCYDVIKLLTEKQKDIVFMKQSEFIGDLGTAFIDAAKNGHLNVVKYLWKNYGRDIKYYCIDWAFEDAAVNNHSDVVRWFFDNLESKISSGCEKRVACKVTEEKNSELALYIKNKLEDLEKERINFWSEEFNFIDFANTW